VTLLWHFFFRLWNLFQKYSESERSLIQAIRQITGRSPVNINLYYLAFSHTSASRLSEDTGLRESNERLEYLGDALLGAVIADYLFKKYPFKDEGFLTDIRSRIVNRESLNQLALKLGLNELIRFEGKRHRMSYKSMNGDALEALVGAVYLDHGFKFCRSFVIQKIVQAQLDLQNVVANNKNFKSLVIEWAQKESRELRFETILEKGSKHHREFTVQLLVDEEPITIGTGLSKKKAEQAAAEKACEELNISYSSQS